MSNSLTIPKEYKNLSEYKVKENLSKRWAEIHKKKNKKSDIYNNIQKGVFPILNEYSDLCVNTKTLENSKYFMEIYAFHILNHLLKYLLFIFYLFFIYFLFVYLFIHDLFFIYFYLLFIFYVFIHLFIYLLIFYFIFYLFIIYFLLNFYF